MDITRWTRLAALESWVHFRVSVDDCRPKLLFFCYRKTEELDPSVLEKFLAGKFHQVSFSIKKLISEKYFALIKKSV